MSEFRVTVEEAVSCSFVMEADSLEDAYEKVEERYMTGDILMESGEVTYVQVHIVNLETDEELNWTDI